MCVCVCMSAENVCTCVRASMSFRVCVHACIQQLLRACLYGYVFSMIVAYVDVYVRVDAYEGACARVCRHTLHSHPPSPNTAGGNAHSAHVARRARTG